jgi:hypothetical protein
MYNSLGDYWKLTSLFFHKACLIASPSVGELVLAYHVLHDLTVSDLLDSAILAGVDVEPAQTLLVNTSRTVSKRDRDKEIPVRLVVHG